MMADVRAAQLRLGARIQMLRQRRGLTQEQLATECGISQKYLSELERGEKAPSFETLVALARRAFRITVAALVFGIDESVEVDVTSVEELIAGRPSSARASILRAVTLLLDVTSSEPLAPRGLRAAESLRGRPRGRKA